MGILARLNAVGQECPTYIFFLLPLGGEGGR